MDLPHLERLIEGRLAAHAAAPDPAHDLAHCRRVVAMAKRLCAEAGADPAIAVPAAWLHDWVSVPKSDSGRALASRRSAAEAEELLRELGYPAAALPAVAHAIEAHSFSAGIAPRTPEAAIVQDADRLDALGAIGIARWFATAGMLRRPLYCEHDPFCAMRRPDDGAFTLDHYFTKLARIAETLHTPAARAEGQRRLAIMQAFLESMRTEIGPDELPSVP